MGYGNEDGDADGLGGTWLEWGWTGLYWTGLDWAGLNWARLCWAGLGWNGLTELAWAGLGWDDSTHQHELNDIEHSSRDCRLGCR